MDEVFELADDISILRDGTVVSEQRASDITPAQVIAEMVGRDLTTSLQGKGQIERRSSRPPARLDMFENINLEIRAGEIVWMIGAGRSEVIRRSSTRSAGQGRDRGGRSPSSSRT